MTFNNKIVQLMAELKDVVDWFGLGVHLSLDVAKLKGIEAKVVILKNASVKCYRSG